jgi:hypothetical protein
VRTPPICTDTPPRGYQLVPRNWVICIGFLSTGVVGGLFKLAGHEGDLVVAPSLLKSPVTQECYLHQYVLHVPHTHTSNRNQPPEQQTHPP